MKEFDFDELDKAVNSLMANQSQRSTPAAQSQNDSDRVISIPSSGSSSQDQVVSSSNVATRPIASSQGSDTIAVTGKNSQVSSPLKDEDNTASERRGASAAVTPRRSGRFMDVVHPSSDMRSTTTKPTSRTGITLTPPTPTTEASVSLPHESITPQLEESRVDSASPLETMQQDDNVVSPNAIETSNTDWPDPIQSQIEEPTTPTGTIEANETDETEVNSSELPSQENQAKPNIIMPSPDSAAKLFGEQPSLVAASEPSSSPFLPGTKVEKRPLGGGVGSPSNPNPLQDNTSDTNDTSSEISSEKISADITAEPPLSQPELSSDLLAIESGTSTPEATQSEPSTAEQQTHKAPQSHAVSHPGLVSKSSPANQTHTPMYDSQSEPHVMLNHPAKKRSGIWIIIGILVLILLGAGGAAALYYFNYL